MDMLDGWALLGGGSEIVALHGVNRVTKKKRSLGYFASNREIKQGTRLKGRFREESL
jgi:hypothetical protein